MSTLNLLYKQEYAINDKIKIYIPTVGEILDFGEDEYYSIISSLTSMPYDVMVQLDDIGIDYSQITEYELFILLFEGIRKQDNHLVFGDLDLTKLKFDENTMSFYDRENDIRVDRKVQQQIAATIRKIHHLEKNRKKPANEEAREYLLKRAREKMKRNKSRANDSQLESLIIALVNTEQFKYDFAEVRDLTIYQFNESVRQVAKKIEYDHKIDGVYHGTVDPKGLSRDDLNWLVHK